MNLQPSHFADRKFRLNFQDCIEAICSCGQENETTTRFLFNSPTFNCGIQTSFEKNNSITSNESIANDLLAGSKNLKSEENNPLLLSTTDFIEPTERSSFVYGIYVSS